MEEGKLAADSRASTKDEKELSAKKEKLMKPKSKKDPNQPKRPPSAFFVFMEEFRKKYMEKNPNVKGVAAIGKAGGVLWKSMSEKEKAPYEEKAALRKANYTKSMDAYNKKKQGGDEDSEEEEEEVKPANGKKKAKDEDEEMQSEEDEEEEEEDDDDD